MRVGSWFPCKRNSHRYESQTQQSWLGAGMHVVFWQNIISPHQAGYMRALAERGHEAVLVAAEAMSQGRGGLGWQPPDVSPARLVLSPSPADVTRLVSESSSDTIHCVAGARVIPLGDRVIRTCRRYSRRMGIISETPDPRGLPGYLRWLKYAIEARRAGVDFDFLLAMGETGVRWFRSVGYEERRVFPFAYVSEIAVGPMRAEDPFEGSDTHAVHNSAVRVLFVGRLVALKGVDILVRAAATVPNIVLDIVGDGPQRSALEQLAGHVGLADRVRWHGLQDPSRVAARLRESDILVLPSRKDGWGAVVNEALLAGTPVICSSAAGACDVLRHEWLGMVVPSEDEAALRMALAKWAKAGRRTVDERSRIRAWASCITGAVVAEYMEKVFAHVYDGGPRPMAPWRL